VAWIKSFQELRHHPKVKRLARACGIPLVQAVGHLHFLWWFALDYAPDGNLSSFTNSEINEMAGWEGDESVFISALADVKFLDVVSGGYCIHDWGEYAGRLIDDRERKREQDRDRAKAYRDRQKERHATVTRDGKERHTLDKSRQDKTKVDKTRVKDENGDAEADDTVQGMRGFDEFWKAYPKRVKKQDAIKAWGQVKAEGLTKVILDSLTQFRSSKEWARENGRYIPYPATWLRNRRWEDEVGNGSRSYGGVHGGDKDGDSL